MVPTAGPSPARGPDASDRPRPLAFGDFSFDPGSRLLRRGDRELPLPPRVLAVLELLLERAGDIVPRQELIERVWKDAFVTDTSLAEAVSVLRQALGDDAQSPAYVQTVHRRGYRFVAPVVARDSVASGTAVHEPRLEVDSPGPSIRHGLLPWSVAALCAVMATAAVWQAVTRRETSPPGVRFTIAPAPGTVFDAQAPALAMAPGGASLAWSACDVVCRLYLRPLDSLEARPLPGSEGAHAPFFSPDGDWIGFFADGRLKKVSVSGGEPVTLADAPEPLGGAWFGRDIIFASSASAGLTRIHEDGGASAPLTAPDHARGELRHTWPSVVPGEAALFFTIETRRDQEGGASLGVMALDGRRSAWRTIVSGVGLAKAAARDLLVFSRGSDLLAAPFDPVRLAINGEPRVVATDAASAGDRVHMALSPDGDMFLGQADPSRRPPLSWWTGEGPVDATADTRQLRNVRLAPDGRRIAGTGTGDSRTDIWIVDLDRGAATRLTHDRVNSSPIWSPDGRAIYFASRENGHFEVWRRDAETSAPAAAVLRSESHAFPGSVSSDGARLAVVLAGRQGTDIGLVDLKTGELRPLARSPFDEDEPAFSPDGSLVAYQSAEAGRWQIHVHRPSDGRRVVVSTAGGKHPVWTRDGAALYFWSESGLMRAAISQTGPGPRAGTPEPVAGAGTARIAGIAPDGRILLDRRDSDGPPRAAVVLGWARAVRQLLGPPTTLMPR